MKQLIFILAITLIAGTSFAIVDETPNTVGLYWDTTAETVDESFIEDGTVGYLVVTKLSFASLAALELSLESDFGWQGVNLHWNPILENLGLNSTSSLPEISLHLETPVVPSKILHICTFEFTAPGKGLDERYLTSECHFRFNPIDSPTIDGAIAGCAGNSTDFVAMNPLQPLGVRAASLNESVQPVDVASWGEIKALYR